MKKINYLFVVVFIFLAASYAVRLLSIKDVDKNGQFSFNIPKISSIKQRLADKTDIGNFFVWGMSRQAGNVPFAALGNATGKIGGYSYKEFNNIPAIYRVKDENYRWEFYGTVMNNGRLFAVFYNPSLKKGKTRVVGKGEDIDTNLRIQQLSNDEVIVKYDKKDSFILKTFNINMKWSKGGIS